MRKKTALIASLLLIFPWITPALATSLEEEDQSAAVILAYSRIGDDYNPENNLRTEQFTAQINTLLAQGYKIISLLDILNAYERHKPLPQKAVAITFEGAYESALKNAIPLLLKHKLPFTVFYAADRADNPSDEFMSWQDLKNLKENANVTLGILPSAYMRLIGIPMLDIQTQFNKSKTKHREMFDEEPDFFSYPFGEYSQEIRTLVKDQGYRAAFSLTSGPASLSADHLALPRFAITDDYSDKDHFNLIINSLPLPISRIEPHDPSLTTSTPSIGFTLHNELLSAGRNLRCFASDQQKPDLEILGDSRVELRLKSPISQYRTRINCTLPVKLAETEDTDIKNWRWLGFFLVYPKNSPD